MEDKSKRPVIARMPLPPNWLSLVPKEIQPLVAAIAADRLSVVPLSDEIAKQLNYKGPRLREHRRICRQAGKNTRSYWKQLLSANARLIQQVRFLFRVDLNFGFIDADTLQVVDKPNSLYTPLPPPRRKKGSGNYKPKSNKPNTNNNKPTGNRPAQQGGPASKAFSKALAKPGKRGIPFVRKKPLE